MNVAAALLAATGGRVTTPTEGRYYAGTRDTVELVATMVRDLGPGAGEFLEAWGQPWAAVIILNTAHPSFADVVEYVHSTPDDGPGRVLLLARPSGPPPPAAIVLEAPG